MAPLPRRPFKALKDQIQEVQINQKAASGRIKSTRIPMLFRAVKMLTKGARTKKKSVDKVTQAPRQFPKAVNNSAQKSGQRGNPCRTGSALYRQRPCSGIYPYLQETAAQLYHQSGSQTIRLERQRDT